MAKRQSLKDKLRKEREAKETKLAPKIALKAKVKDVDGVAKQAAAIHKEVTTPLPPKPQAVKAVKAVKKSAKIQKEEEEKERLTVWLPKSMLKAVKIHVATEETKLTDYFTKLVKQDLKIK